MTGRQSGGVQALKDEKQRIAKLPHIQKRFHRNEPTASERDEKINIKTVSSEKCIQQQNLYLSFASR